MIKALIFDFDGVVIDTEKADYLSWQEIYASFDQELPLKIWSQGIGTVGGEFEPLAYLESLLGYRIDREAVEEVRRPIDNALIADLEILPGVEMYMQSARQLGFKLAVASSGDHAWVDTHLKRIGLWSRFDAVYCRDDVDNKPKPDPAVYLAATNALGVLPTEALAIEDSQHGLLAAKRAGLWCVVVPNEMTRHLDFRLADKCLQSLAEKPLSQLIDEVVYE